MSEKTRFARRPTLAEEMGLSEIRIDQVYQWLNEICSECGGVREGGLIDHFPYCSKVRDRD